MKSLQTPDKKIRVNFFQRRPHKGFSFSLEAIFEDVRKRLADKIDATVFISKYYNSGYVSKLLNTLQATFRQNGGVNHITGEVHFLDLFMKKKRVVLTILDCGMVHRKEGIAKKIITWLYLSAPVKKAAYITAISEETRQEIIKYTGCSPDLVHIIPVAVDDRYQPVPKVFNKQKPLILHIGTGYNKNLPRLIEALNGIPCHLTIVGKLSDEIISLLQKNGIEYSNEYNISNERLYEKYQECDIISFVSLFEGFGMPIVEGNAVERVVVTSNISSMPEVAANAACLVDPHSVESIRSGLLKVISDDTYRDSLITNGRINKQRFHADTIANMYYAAYKKVASQ